MTSGDGRTAPKGERQDARHPAGRSDEGRVPASRSRRQITASPRGFFLAATRSGSRETNDTLRQEIDAWKDLSISSDFAADE
jgi:hypothetical protein